MVTALDFPTQQVRFEFRSLRFQVKTPDKLYAHLCLCHQTVKFGTGQEAIVSCNWEGITVGLASQTLVFIHLRADDLRRGDEHSTYTPRRVWHTLIIIIIIIIVRLFLTRRNTTKTLQWLYLYFIQHGVHASISHFDALRLTKLLPSYWR